MYIHIHIYICTCMCLYIYIYTYTYKVETCMGAYIHTYIHAFIYLCTCICMCIYTYIHTYICVYICVYVSVYTDIHLYTELSEQCEYNTVMYVWVCTHIHTRAYAAEDIHMRIAHIRWRFKRTHTHTSWCHRVPAKRHLDLRYNQWLIWYLSSPRCSMQPLPTSSWSKLTKLSCSRSLTLRIPPA